MKKLSLLFGFGLLVLASCTKEYTCECVYTDNAGIEPSYTTKTSLTNTKKGAEENCDFLSGTSYSGQTTYTTTCSIK